MPVTAKLSKKFYQRLGDEIATELLEWFNAVDATYRSEVRETADAQSARIDAQMGQLRAELRQGLAEQEARLRVEIAGVRAEMRQEIGGLRGDVRTGLADLKSELLRWMFLFWAGAVGSALLLRL